LPAVESVAPFDFFCIIFFSQQICRKNLHAIFFPHNSLFYKSGEDLRNRTNARKRGEGMKEREDMTDMWAHCHCQNGSMVNCEWF
jgi:hypothetical protein